MQQENTKNKFKQAEIRGQGGGVCAVEKEVQGERVQIDTNIIMEQEITRVNRARLLQAYNTPLREHPLQALLGE